MRDYGKVYSTFWSSQTTGGLSDDAKLLALYLMTCSHSTIAGVFRLPDGYVSEDLGWDAERVSKGFAELLLKGFANRCETTKWVWVRKHLEWNKPENPNQRKAAAKVALSVPDECGWKLDFMRVSSDQLGIEWKEPANPSGTVEEPLLNQKQEQKQEQDQKSPSLRSGDTEGKPRTSRSRRELITLTQFLEACKAAGEKPVPLDAAVRTYCRDAGISDEMLQIAWLVFKDRHLNADKDKRYKDWEKTFANSVKDRWYKLWFDDAGEVKWTSTGLQEKRVIETRLAEKKAAADHADGVPA